MDKERHFARFRCYEGSFDRAKICELVGLYLLDQLKDIVTNGSIGLYRDDGVAVVHKYCGRQIGILRKDIIDFFKQHSFQVTIEINLKITDFLDISLDLENDKSTNTENLKTHLYTYTVNLIFL